MTQCQATPPGRDGSVRTAVITGGSGGIGVACARLLVERGYDVVLTARRPEPL
ncbi:MAG: SDR family NAD(P)-dependent oxidoreductase, partial [Acidimicrobiales bacterium]